MDYFHVVLRGILLGATLSCIVGPAMFSLIQTSINYGFKSGMYFAIGISLSDIFLVCLAYLGFSSFMENPKTNTIISIIGGAVLIIFGTYTFTKRAPLSSAKNVELRQPFFGKYILKGFIFNIVNPSVWFYWLVPVGVATSYGNSRLSYAFLVSMLLTILSFDLLKCGISYKLKALMTDKVITLINKIVGIILILIGIYLIISIFDRFEFIHHLPLHKK